MARSIEFDVDELIGRLNVFQATQIKYAGKQALRRLGYELQGKLRDEMARVFDRPVPFTLSSPRRDPEITDLTLRIFLNPDSPGGQSPSRYLYPVSTEDAFGVKPTYITRFAKALRHLGVIDPKMYPVPWRAGRGVPTNDYGNVPASYYQSVLAGIKRMGVAGGPRTIQAGFRVFSVPDKRLTNSRQRFNPLSKRPGIYRAKGRQLELLFAYETKHPTVGTIFDYRGVVTRSTAQLLPTLLSQELAKAMR